MPVLLTALRDPLLVSVKEPALQALGAMGPAAKAAVPALTVALTDPDTFLRREAAAALANIGPAAKAASPALMTALQDGDAVVRQLAAAALKKVDPKPKG